MTYRLRILPMKAMALKVLKGINDCQPETTGERLLTVLSRHAWYHRKGLEWAHSRPLDFPDIAVKPRLTDHHCTPSQALGTALPSVTCQEMEAPAASVGLMGVTGGGTSYRVLSAATSH